MIHVVMNADKGAGNTEGFDDDPEVLHLDLLPKGVIVFPGSGITENLNDKARQPGTPVQRFAARRG